ncbi:MAG: hypothetical protein JSS64_02440 [Bacteroidetes bacterium]|nr:hypothetical protein [Bacteroidota bacterium]
MNKIVSAAAAASLLFISLRCPAQLSIGNGGMSVQSGAVMVASGLCMQPTQNLLIKNNTLQVSSTPVPSTPNSSIAQVYTWTDTVRTQGLVGIYVSPSALNGNNFNLLKLAYSATGSNGSYIISNTSTASPIGNLVSDVLPLTLWKHLTAMESDTVLSLRLLSFTGEAKHNTHLLYWQTADERNNKGFEVQRSADGKAFAAIGFVNADKEAAVKHHYNFTDALPLGGANYYRLKMENVNGSYEYSNTIKLEQGKAAYASFAIFPKGACIMGREFTKKQIEMIARADVMEKTYKLPCGAVFCLLLWFLPQRKTPCGILCI